MALKRIQVRCTSYLRESVYRINVTHALSNHERYRPDQIDFLAGLIVPLQAWYIIPVVFLADRWTLQFAPHLAGTKAQTEQFREAWHLLRG